MLGRLGVRRALALTMLVSSLAVVSHAQSSTRGCEISGQLTTSTDLWTKIKAPAFTSGASQLVGYDVDRLHRDHLMVTNGDRMAVTLDGGCRWSESAAPAASALPSLPTDDGVRVVSASITQVRTAAGMDYGSPALGVWAIGQSTVLLPAAPTSQPRILQSADGGHTFTDQSGAFPSPFGAPVSVLAVTPRSALVLFHQTAPKDTYEVYATGSGGASWSLLYSGLPSVSDLALDVWHSKLLVWGAAGLFTGSLLTTGPSTDLKVYQATDSTMTQVAAVTHPVRAVTIDRDYNGSRSFTAYLDGVSVRMTSADGGKTFRSAAEPDELQSASQGPLSGLVALSGRKANVVVEPPTDPAFRGITATNFSPDAAKVHDVRFSDDYSFRPSFTGVTFPLYASSPTALYRRDIPSDFRLPNLPPLKVPRVDVSVHGVKPVRGAATINPADAVISLQPGQTKTVSYRIGLPPIPTPLDVFFMTDSTGSMSSAIASVQDGIQDIVNNLAASGIDANFGVADFRDYSVQQGNTKGGTGASENYPYLRHRAIGLADNEFADALQSISTGGGTTDGDDSALEAVYQAATGAGRPDPALLRGSLIPRGQGADWRGKALKVIVLASDDEMRHPETNPGYPGPSLSTVSQALHDNDVHLVGIAVRTSGASARADMTTLAQASNTLAPSGGIDCDDDGETDVPAGEPIVCPFSPSTGNGIAPTFIALLEGIKDYAAVDLAVTGDAAVAKPLAQTHFPKVNVKAPSDYTLPVQFSCDAAHVGTTTQVKIGVESRQRRVISTSATVRCLVAEPPAKVPPIVLLPAVVPPPPPPPPAPVTNAQPNPNPNPNPNPQVNANAGAATNEEDQAQLATAESDQGEATTGDELAFSARNTDQSPLPDLAWVGIVMLMSAAAFGTHLSRRSSTWGQLRSQETR